ncbi:MAG: prephenate dehydratase [Caulobacteraceae bacterium]|nr:prephenate dehydratase [Caulobacteraceae bacterium]
MSPLPKIAFQGELGANSHEACSLHFPGYEAMPCPTFDEAFEAVRSGACALAMIPVENSVAGRVADVHHLLPSSGLKIIGERFMPIHHQLLANRGVSLSQVREVSSHVMALAQCRKVIKSHGLTAHIVGDTAGAARFLAANPDPTQAAIASRMAAELYGLDILQQDIEDAAHNTTRFLVMTADPLPEVPPSDTRCVTSFVFRVRNLPAALYKALGGFATNGVNMSKLESYMEDGAFTATMFYAEVDGRPEDAAMRLAFEELGFFTDRFEILGVYPADPFRDRV